MNAARLASPLMQPLAYRPSDAAQMIGLSRSSIYELIADGTLKAKKFGTVTVIPHEELVRYLAEADDAEATKRAQASIR